MSNYLFRSPAGFHALIPIGLGKNGVDALFAQAQQLPEGDDNARLLAFCERVMQWPAKKLTQNFSRGRWAHRDRDNLLNGGYSSMDGYGLIVPGASFQESFDALAHPRPHDLDYSRQEIEWFVSGRAKITRLVRKHGLLAQHGESALANPFARCLPHMASGAWIEHNASEVFAGGQAFALFGVPRKDSEPAGYLQMKRNGPEWGAPLTRCSLFESAKAAQAVGERW